MDISSIVLRISSCILRQLSICFYSFCQIANLPRLYMNFSLLQVRLAQILESGRVETKKLGKHHGRVYKLAVEPGSPYVIYSCGEDGFVQHVGLFS